jgi:hypothetical protein
VNEAVVDLDPRTRRMVDRLASLSRPAGSTGERDAAEMLAGELERCGATARIEREQVHGTYWWPIGLSCAFALSGARLPRVLATLAGALGALAVADDLEIGVRPLRRRLAQRTTCNVVAHLGPDVAPHTLVVHAHHDAARSGFVFDPRGAKLVASVAGELIERVGGTPAPMWGASAGPAAVALGELLGVRALRRLGVALTAGYLAAMADIGRSAVVPGANDNLSGVAVLLELARRLAGHPPQGLRVLLLSTGSEESFLEAMVRFGQRHFARLAKDSTTFLCIESVGSPELMLLQGEGLLRLHRYPADLIARLSALAEERGIALHDPFRYRLATDGQVPLRAGYRTAVISSIDWYKAPSNYHWPSDRPEHLCWSTVAEAAALAYGFVRELDEAAGEDGAR